MHLPVVYKRNLPKVCSTFSYGSQVTPGPIFRSGLRDQEPTLSQPVRQTLMLHSPIFISHIFISPIPLQAVFIDIWFLIWLEGYALLDNSALKYFWECQHKVLYGKRVSRSSLGPPGNPKKNTFLRRHFRFYSKFKVYWEMAWVQWAETWPIKFSIYCKKQSLTRGVGQAFSLST